MGYLYRNLHCPKCVSKLKLVRKVKSWGGTSADSQIEYECVLEFDN